MRLAILPALVVLLCRVSAADELSDIYSALSLNDGRVVSVETTTHTYEVSWDDANLTFVVKKDSTAATDVLIVGDVVPITFTALTTGNTAEVNGSAIKSSASTLKLTLTFRPESNYVYNLTVDLDLTDPVSSDPVEVPESQFAEVCKCVGGTDGCTTTECDFNMLCANNKGRCKWVKSAVVSQ